VQMSEQARKIEHEAIPQGAEGLHYKKGSSAKYSSITTMRLSTSSIGGRRAA
jgi:hypothetical protein